MVGGIGRRGIGLGRRGLGSSSCGEVVSFFSVRGDLDVVGFFLEVDVLAEVIGLIAEGLCAARSLWTVVGTSL